MALVCFHRIGIKSSVLLEAPDKALKSSAMLESLGSRCKSSCFQRKQGLKLQALQLRTAETTGDLD